MIVLRNQERETDIDQQADKQTGKQTNNKLKKMENIKYMQNRFINELRYIFNAYNYVVYYNGNSESLLMAIPTISNVNLTDISYVFLFLHKYAGHFEAYITVRLLVHLV